MKNYSYWIEKSCHYLKNLKDLIVNLNFHFDYLKNLKKNLGSYLIENFLKSYQSFDYYLIESLSLKNYE